MRPLPPSTHLSAVCDVDDDVSLLVEDPLAQGCKVRCVVGVAAVRFDHGERDGLTRGEDNLTTLVQLQQAWGDWGGGGWGQMGELNEK